MNTKYSNSESPKHATFRHAIGHMFDNGEKLSSEVKQVQNSF